jgi:hypothetical protein
VRSVNSSSCGRLRPHCSQPCSAVCTASVLLEGRVEFSSVACRDSARSMCSGLFRCLPLTRRFDRLLHIQTYIRMFIGQNGRILRHWHAMSGFAGLSRSRNRKPEGSTSSGYARNLRKECAGLAAGQAVLTAEVKDSGIRKLLSRPIPLVRLSRLSRNLLNKSFQINKSV